MSLALLRIDSRFSRRDEYQPATAGKRAALKACDMSRLPSRRSRYGGGLKIEGRLRSRRFSFHASGEIAKRDQCAHKGCSDERERYQDGISENKFQREQRSLDQKRIQARASDRASSISYDDLSRAGHRAEQYHQSRGALRGEIGTEYGESAGLQRSHAAEGFAFGFPFQIGFIDYLNAETRERALGPKLRPRAIPREVYRHRRFDFVVGVIEGSHLIAVVIFSESVRLNFR
jgi:hypothetical protein